jgi:hypothetical protein
MIFSIPVGRLLQGAPTYHQMWPHGPTATARFPLQLNLAWSEVAILERLFGNVPGIDAYRESVRGITRESNHVLLRTVEDTASVFSDGAPQRHSAEELRFQRDAFVERLTANRKAFLIRNQAMLLEILEREGQAAVA